MFSTGKGEPIEQKKPKQVKVVIPVGDEMHEPGI
jgi:hypothetical protein